MLTKLSTYYKSWALELEEAMLQQQTKDLQSVDVYDKGYEKTSGPRKEIGNILVPTKKFLKGLNRMVVLDKAM